MVIAIHRMDGNLRAGGACSHWQVPVRVKERVEDLSNTEDVLTIFGGPHEAGNNRRARDRYAKEASRLTQAMVHKADMRPAKGAQREPTDIIFVEVDAKWVQHPHTDALVITVKIANSIVHRILVDNSSARQYPLFERLPKDRADNK